MLFLLNSCSKNDRVENIPSKENIATSYDYIPTEIELANLINNYRTSIGLNPLVLENFVSKISAVHNVYMIDKNSISHDLFQERFKEIVTNLGAKKVAENVAFNFNSSQSALNAWINSPEHKANLEGDFTHFGISIKTNASGTKFYTNIFYKK